MQQFSDADFAKVRRLIELKDYQSKLTPEASDNYLTDQSIRRSVEECSVIIKDLVNYYFEHIDKTGDERVTEDYRDGTKKEAVMRSIFRTSYRDADPTPDGPRIHILQDAMQHYEVASAQDRVKEHFTLIALLDKKVKDMTGHELLKILQEHDRLRANNRS